MAKLTGRSAGRNSGRERVMPPRSTTTLSTLTMFELEVERYAASTEKSAICATPRSDGRAPSDAAVIDSSPARLRPWRSGCPINPHEPLATSAVKTASAGIACCAVGDDEGWTEVATGNDCERAREVGIVRSVT